MQRKKSRNKKKAPPVSPLVVFFEAVRKNKFIKAAQLVESNQVTVDAREPGERGDTALMIAASLGHVEMIMELCTLGADKNAQNKLGETALICATVSNQTEGIMVLHANGADVNFLSDTLGTAVYQAAVRGNKKAIACLILCKAELDKHLPNKMTPMHAAAIEGHWEVVDLLQRHANSFDLNVIPVMVKHMRLSGFLKFVGLLGKHGVDEALVVSVMPDKVENYCNPDMQRDLYDLVIREKDVAVAQGWYSCLLNPATVLGHMFNLPSPVRHELLEKLTQAYITFLYANPSLQTKENDDLINSAQNRLTIDNIVSAKHLEVDKLDEESMTPIMRLAKAGLWSALEKLIPTSKNLALENADGLNFVALAVAAHCLDDLVDFFKVLHRCGMTHEAIISLLPKTITGYSTDVQSRQYGAVKLASSAEHAVAAIEQVLDPANLYGYIFNLYSPDHCFLTEGVVLIYLDLLKTNPQLKSDKTKRTLSLALYKMARTGSEEIVRELIAAGADVNFTMQENNKTPLYAASRYGHESVVKLLLESGANPEMIVGDGETALIAAAFNGQLPVVELLVNAGANINHARGVDNATSLYVAACFGYVGIVTLLVERGAHTETPNCQGKTAVMIARERDHGSVVSILEEKKKQLLAYRQSQASPTLWRNALKQDSTTHAPAETYRVSDIY